MTPEQKQQLENENWKSILSNLFPKQPNKIWRKLEIMEFIEKVIQAARAEAYEKGRKDERRENIDTAFKVAHSALDVQWEEKLKKAVINARADQRERDAKSIEPLKNLSIANPPRAVINEAQQKILNQDSQ